MGMQFLVIFPNPDGKCLIKGKKRGGGGGGGGGGGIKLLGFGLKGYLFFEIGLLHGEEELLAVWLGPLRRDQKRRRNRPRRPRVLRHERREL
jgi:hypothetical protein